MTSTIQSLIPGNSKDLLSQGDHTVHINGVELHYYVCGEGPLLFLVSPGWGVGSDYLQRGFKFLEKQFKLVFVDTRGSGLSGRPSDSSLMGSNEMADDLEALREYLDLSSIKLIGHSNGGAIALSYALRYQKSLSKLMLIDGQLFGFSAGEDTQAFLAAGMEDSRYKYAAQTAVTFFSGKAKPPLNDAELSAFVADILPLYLHNPEKNLETAKKEIMIRPVSLYAFGSQNAADAAAKNDFTGVLNQIQVNTLIINGQYDWICPLAVAQRMHDGIPHSQLVVFEESGHMVWIEEPEKFHKVLLTFLTP